VGAIERSEREWECKLLSWMEFYNNILLVKYILNKL
jgi:hypothetical protein